MVRLLGGLTVLAVAVVAQLPAESGGKLPLTVYTLEEVEALAARFEDRGILDLDDAMARVRGPGMFYLHSALALYLPAGAKGGELWAEEDGQDAAAESGHRGSEAQQTPGGGGVTSAGPAEPGSLALRVMKVHSERTWPDVWDCRTGEDGWAVCVVPFAESLRWDEAVVRFKTGTAMGGDEDEDGEGRSPSPERQRRGADSRYGTKPTDEPWGRWHRISLLRDRTYSEPGYPELCGIHDESEWAVMRWRIPVLVSGDGPMLLIPSSSESAGEVRVGGILLTGIAHSFVPGGRMVVIDGGQKGKHGLLTVEWHFDRPNRFVGRMLPDMLEVELSGPDALELLESR